MFRRWLHWIIMLYEQRNPDKANLFGALLKVSERFQAEISKVFWSLVSMKNDWDTKFLTDAYVTVIDDLRGRKVVIPKEDAVVNYICIM